MVARTQMEGEGETTKFGAIILPNKEVAPLVQAEGWGGGGGVLSTGRLVLERGGVWVYAGGYNVLLWVHSSHRGGKER